MLKLDKNTAYGLSLALLSQALFAVLSLFGLWMKPLSGTDVFAVRMPAMLCGILAILLPSVGWRSLRDFVRSHLGTNVRQWLLMLVGTAIVGSQFWLFMWAPVNGQGVNLAMGYFLFPLVMALLGRVVLKEVLTPVQIAALSLAAAGVGHELWVSHSFSWVSFWACAAYPPYYLLRRAQGIPVLHGLAIDLCLITPFALWYVLGRSDVVSHLVHMPKYWLLVPSLGVMSALSMSANLKASALLSVSVFSMLSYVEPALLFLLSVTVLKSPVSEGAYLTYGLIWSGLGLLLLNGVGTLRRNRMAAVYSQSA